MPFSDMLANNLREIPSLEETEREAIFSAALLTLSYALHGRLARTLLLELHIAREEGRLHGETSERRWQHFIELTSHQDFWQEVGQHYPSLPARLTRLLRNRCAAITTFAERLARDRESLSVIYGSPVGRLQSVSFGAGDSHQRGQTVAIVTFENYQLVYKPRSLAIDVELARFLVDVAEKHQGPVTVRVPRALTREDYGWAEFVDHRYAANERELRSFYQGVGQWLSVLRLLGGTDMHAENLIACGAFPTIVDCETLFTPKPLAPRSDYGLAVDQAAGWMAGTVLGTGMLPGRGAGLGWRGVDMSSIGALPDQQPLAQQPAILKAGTDEAYLGTKAVPVALAKNHPHAQPSLADYWPHVLDAFDAMNQTLRQWDESNQLRPRLERFAACQIRVVPRATEVYAELARMLWHPVSLRNTNDATERARDLLHRMAANSALAPSDEHVIGAEIEDLKDGDIPFFFTTAAQGQLYGPRGTRWLAPVNLIDTAMDHWRAADLAKERDLIHAALVSAYMNDDGASAPSIGNEGGSISSGWLSQPHFGDADRRRRARLKAIMQAFLRHATHGEDGSVTWIAPSFDPETGWSLRPLARDLYSGLSGVGVLVAAYQHEMRSGRADPVEGLDKLLEAILLTMRKAEAKQESLRTGSIKVRPLPPGGYAGLGSLLWSWLTLDRVGNLQGAGVEHACGLARLIPEAAAESDSADVLFGIAGAIPPLLALAERTQDSTYLELATQLGDQLKAAAMWKADTAYWTHSSWPNGLGGFSHGATGIGWALIKLSRASGKTCYQDLAHAAFAFEEELFDPHEQNWLDLRNSTVGKTVTAWCHGAIGIGLAHLDLDPPVESVSTRQQLHRAASATLRSRLGQSQCACHGDASAWELLDAAITHGIEGIGMSKEALLARWLTALEKNDLSQATGVFQPGLMVGVGGTAYQLLRAHPNSELPSILTLANR